MDNMVDIVEDFEEFVLTAHNWETVNKVANGHDFMKGRYCVDIRKFGKGRNAVFQSREVRKVPVPKGDLVEVISGLVNAAGDMFQPEINVDRKAVGGGMGHYDYAVVAEISGWVEMSAGEVLVMRELQEAEKVYARKLREAAKLEKQVSKLRGF